jgi:lactoylglutathione lyase
MIKFVHTNIITDDWQRLSNFYINVFNCIPLLPKRDQKGQWLDKLTGIQEAHLRGIHLLLPGHSKDSPTLEIYQYSQNKDIPLLEPNTKGNGHIAFEVDDVRSMLTKVLANGGSVVGELVESVVEGVGKITVVYARDIDGNIIELQSWEK